MPYRRPFTWLLLAGAVCSLAGLVSTRVEPAKGRGIEPLPETSAPLAETAESSNAVPTVVTKEPPATSPASDVAGLPAATPTRPAPESTRDTAPVLPTVGALPARGVVQAAVLESSKPKSAGLLDLMNAARIKEGLEALEADNALAEVALARARNLVANGYFDHYAPDGESAFSELAARGIQYRLAGENLARNNYAESRTVAAAFEGLMGSPGHRANILEVRFSSVGIAAVQSGKMWIYVTVFLN